MQSTALSLVLAIPALAPSAGGQDCWVVEETLTTNPTIHFGVSVALSGDTLLIANEATDTGARAYVRSGSSWIFQQELLTSTATFMSNFARVVALDGDVAVTTNSGLGVVFVFRRVGTTWTEEAQLTVGSSTLFGQSVALDGERLAVTAPGTSEAAVYVFERRLGGWVQTQRIDVKTGRGFEKALALQGNTLAIRRRDFNSSQASDEVRVYVHDGTSWVLEQALPTPGPDRFFGASLDLCGDRLAVGSPSENDPDADAVFLYTRTAGVWSLEATLTPAPGTGRYFQYGASVALDGARLAVGAVDLAYGVLDLGRVVLYELAGGTWDEKVTLQPPPPSFTQVSSAHDFGWSADLQGTTLVAGDPTSRSFFASGTAWVFESDPSVAPASVTYRNAGSNPVSYDAGEARLGETLELTVAPAMTGHSQALVFGFDSPGTLLLGSGQTLLCLDLGGNGQLLNTGFRPGPFAFFQIPVPYKLDLIGVQVCTQAVHAFGAPGFALSNAQDLRIGPPSGACP